MTVPADRFDAMRTAIQRQVDRVAALAPEVERALVAAHGPDWARLLAARARAAGRSTSGLHDPRYLLRLVAHEPALAERFAATGRRDARLLAAIANSVAHTDLGRLRPDDDVTAARLADRLVALVPSPLPSGPPPATASTIRAPRRVPRSPTTPATRTPRPVPSPVIEVRTGGRDLPASRQVRPLPLDPPPRAALPPSRPPAGLLPAPASGDSQRSPAPLDRRDPSLTRSEIADIAAAPSAVSSPLAAEPRPLPALPPPQPDASSLARRRARAGRFRLGRRHRVCLLAVAAGLCAVGLVWELAGAPIRQVVASLQLGFALVPDDMDCMLSWDRVEDAAGAVGCTATDGPYSVRAYYHRFSDPEALRRYFEGRVREARGDATARSGRPGSCATPGHVARYRTTSHGHHGRVLCVRDGDDYRIEWADRTTRVYTSATTADRYRYLYRWWLDRAGPGRYGGQAPPKER